MVTTPHSRSRDTWNGALICDGVGSGKTYIGLMLLERYLRENKRVLLITPKSIAESVWNSQVNRQLRSEYGPSASGTLRYKNCIPTSVAKVESVMTIFSISGNTKTLLLLTRAHHFRNPGSNRGRLLMELARDKKLYLLTATPINNSLDDIYHLINYFRTESKKPFR